MHLRHAMKSARSTFGLDVSKIGVLVTSADTQDLVLPLATLCMVAKYNAIEWPSVLINTEMNVVQQRMHLRHAMKGVHTISARFVDRDSELLNVSVC